MAWPSSDKVKNGMAKFGQGENSSDKFKQDEEWHGQVRTRCGMAWPSSDKVRNGMAKFGQGKEWHGQV